MIVKPGRKPAPAELRRSLFDFVWVRAGDRLLAAGKGLEALQAVQALLDEPPDAPEPLHANESDQISYGKG